MGSIGQIDPSIAEAARRLAPVVWLIGKVQSGKTSIIRELTRADEAEIGSGFRACTKSARVFDFPREAPIVRFLDTRGLGEMDYDPGEDIAFCETQAHLILAVVKAMDPAQEAVLETVRAAKRRHPDWPVAVAQTSLHEGYDAGRGHALPYPFGASRSTSFVPERLMRSLDYQCSLFTGIAQCCVPIDFTQPGDGLSPANYGRDALLDALADVAPAAVRASIHELPSAHDATSQNKSDSQILGFALAAGASDAVPAVGVVTVPAVQAAMLHQLGKLHGVHWGGRAYAELAGALGGSVLARVASIFALRQLIKLIPVYGQTVGAATAAATSFATTYAIGKAAHYYLAHRRRGLRGDEIASIYRAALQDAFRVAGEKGIGARPGGGAP
jgi:uncharacterized protein (DUF697 family)